MWIPDGEGCLCSSARPHYCHLSPALGNYQYWPATPRSNGTCHQGRRTSPVYGCQDGVPSSAVWQIRHRWPTGETVCLYAVVNSFYGRPIIAVLDHTVLSPNSITPTLRQSPGQVPGKVADTNRESPRHKSRYRLSWFASATCCRDFVVNLSWTLSLTSPCIVMD